MKRGRARSKAQQKGESLPPRSGLASSATPFCGRTPPQRPRLNFQSWSFGTSGAKPATESHRRQAQSEGTIPYPRHPVITSEPPVIASGAKQSRGLPRLDCFAASRLAMTTCRGGPWAHRTMNEHRPPFGGRGPLGWIASPFGFAMTMVSCHCERSEAIQCEGTPRLDCFVANGNYVAAASQ
ncbi:MAG: hypothetical protein LBT00_16505 [Spirochaetaceae bacterium]|nr:hypothetical protein [Spirochaetaceae bacterium]